MNDAAKAEQAKREAHWIEQMESLGTDVVRMRLANRMAINDDGPPNIEPSCARKWLRGKDEANEKVAVAAKWYLKWTFGSAAAAAVLGLLGIIVSLRL